MRGKGRAELLDSYDAERRPVGADVVARTQAASVNMGRSGRRSVDRLADTQILVSYKGSPLVSDEASVAMAGPVAGDRAPDVPGLARTGFGFPLRLFDVLKGTGHVLLINADAADASDANALAQEFAAEWGAFVRVVAILAAPLPETPYLTGLVDAQGGFVQAYGPDARAILVRPDGYIGWRGPSWRSPGLQRYFERLFLRKRQARLGNRSALCPVGAAWLPVARRAVRRYSPDIPFSRSAGEY